MVKDDLEHLKSYHLLSAELKKRGYKVERFVFDYRYSIFKAPFGGQWLTRDALLSYPFVAPIAKFVSIEKVRAQQFVARQGVPVPRTLVFPDDAGHMRSFMETYAPLIVKPANSQGSRGLFFNISDESSLQAAIKDALQYSDKVLIQQQFTGTDVRLTVCRGKVVSAILRFPPQVIGDGESTVQQLIARENHARLELDLPYIKYPQLTPELIPGSFFHDLTIPAAGQVVGLSKLVSIKDGASPINITGIIHESYEAAAIRLAEVLSPEFLVVDLLVDDYRQPATGENHIFMEFTTSPSLKTYCSLRDKPQPEIVPLVADLIDDYCRRQPRHLSE